MKRKPTPAVAGGGAKKDKKKRPPPKEEAQDSSSSSSSSSDSEDDIKMYGEAEEGDSSSSSSEEEEKKQVTAVKGKGKNKKNKKAEEGNGSKGVEVSFDFSDPDERFFFGIRSLLQWLAAEDVDVTALAELIVQEKGLGSIIHCVGETDVFALATTLNVQAHQGNAGMQSLCDKVLRKRCPPSLQPALEKALGSPETFVFLHGRFVNLPLPLIPLLHKSCHEDMAWAQSNDATFPHIKHLFALSPCTVDLAGGNNTVSIPYAPNDAIYDRFEDEFFVQGAEFNFAFRRSVEMSKEKDKEGDGGDAAPTKKKKKKAANEGGGGSGGAVDGGHGVVVSLLETHVVVDSLPQIEEMVG